MRRLFITLFVSLFLILTACTPTEINSAPTEEEITQPASKPTEESITPPIDDAKPEVLTEETMPISDYRYETPYYTLTMPGNWKNDCFFEFYEFENGTYNLAVYEAQGYEDWKIGYLFSILLYEPTQDYTIFSNYRVLGTIESPNWEYNVIALFPSDVQFSEETAEVYGQMYSKITEILESFTPTDACHYYPDKLADVYEVYETIYYTLDFPKSWGGNCVREVILNEDFTYTLILSEAQSYEEFGGGKLCSIMLIPTDDDTYKDFPDYELLAALDTPEGSFYAVALFPTDVQFSENTAEIYHSMKNQLMDILYSMKPRQNIEMALP